MPLPFVICLIGFGVLQIAAFLVYAIWIPRFVEGHGSRIAGSTTHLLLGSGWLRDYREAQTIGRRIGRTPWFVRVFEIFQCLAVLFFIGGIASTVSRP
jgi:hypothetical protein